MATVYKFSEVVMTKEQAASVYAQWYGAITKAQSTDIEEYFRLLGLDPFEMRKEFPPNEE